MIIKKIERKSVHTQKFFVDYGKNGSPVIGFDDGPCLSFDVNSADDLGKILGVLIGYSEKETVCKGLLEVSHVIEPFHRYRFACGDHAVFLTWAEAFVVTKALESMCLSMVLP